MANRTDKAAVDIHGTNPQFLVEKIVRTRIYASLYWKEDCFALTAATVISGPPWDSGRKSRPPGRPRTPF